ncbi:hypothetical protein [Sessilibacter corallicola]|uniref:hypothetical protein n=1 Tax=Sessilibacter corallicola TaxID=2904075 RepID=UPI001E5B9A4B|nr:hypothetical protein [Sessilibacter corallicola]MCE2028542.1 hypothetical protein [Sessilibacter corallicola]
MSAVIKSLFYKVKSQFALCLISLFPAVALAHPGHSSEGSLMHAAEHGIWLTLAFAVFAILYSVTLLVKSRLNKRVKHSEV